MDSTHKIYITSFDKERLDKILMSPAIQTGPNREHLAALQKELERAVIVDPKDIPADIVTMNSKFRMRDMQTGEVTEYTLVFPHEADITQNRLSVLAPIGMGLLGYKAGDVFEWAVPSGKRVLKVEEILYQPEASGKDRR
ncbi:MAG TPA: nucleoside diphosphate kinase regulator [Candidatus Aminicenantes bacterium]|nr:nucleoside diphosphate kinase regulator [Candidatus Aminicenantes bacterium]